MTLELGDIQGNVLQGYGFSYAAYVSLRVRGGRHARGLLAELLPRVTPASPWNGDKPSSTLNVALSYRALVKLGVEWAVLESFPVDFREGMARRAPRLGDAGDSGPERWEQGLRFAQIDLLVMLQAREEDVLRARLTQLRARVDVYPGVTLTGVHEARVRSEEEGWPREPFGFRDGFSQPAIRGAPGRLDPGQGVPIPVLDGGWRLLEPGEFILGYRDEDGGLPEAPVPPFARNGTFMVYRKLEQDVPAFERLLRSVADEHFERDQELVAAKLAGRWRDGTPTLLHPYLDEGSGAREVLNDFSYGGDPGGRACPLGAHVRRANPRDGLHGGAQRTRRHRIIRRGMPYDEGDRCGLIFVCFNASITRQFEVVNGWLRDGDAFGLGRDPDIMAGAREPGATVGMTVQGDPPVRFESPEPLVRTRGGEYLFLPGLTTLGTLADETAIVP